MHIHPFNIDHAVAERRARLIQRTERGERTGPSGPRRGPALRRLAPVVSILALIVGGGVLVATVDPVPATTCAGRTATITGTPGSDVLEATPERDVIHGLGGDDTVTGVEIDDVVCGGTGLDTVLGATEPSRSAAL